VGCAALIVAKQLRCTFHTTEPTNALILKLYFLRTVCHNSEHVSIFLDHLQGVTERL